MPTNRTGGVGRGKKNKGDAVAPTEHTEETTVGEPQADPRWTVTVRDLPLELIDEDENNARDHSEDNLDSIGHSLDEYGLQKPIVVAPKPDGRFRVLAGNGTLRVARRMGATVISASISGLQGLKQVGYAIADNKTQETSAWNYERLRGQLTKLAQAGFRMPATGWSAPEIRNITSFGGGLGASAPPPPAPPGPPTPVAPAQPSAGDEHEAEAEAPGPVIKSEVFVLNPEEVELLDRIAAANGIPESRTRLREALMHAVRSVASGLSTQPRSP